MECDINSSNIPVCICQRTCPYFNKRKRRQLCGSNGHLYENFCELYRDGCRRREDITISDMSVCVTSETSTIQVQQQLDCSSDEYALMKDNLLLFHHQNMAYLQHGSINEVHRMDYLVSIIFSHYDQNNDGLVEKDELAFMWNTMDMHHVANDSNCTLLDMLVYDDTNNDQVLTINEFNDAFRRISEVNTESYKQTPTYGKHHHLHHLLSSYCSLRTHVLLYD
jgi:follistatin-related protein 5